MMRFLPVLLVIALVQSCANLPVLAVLEFEGKGKSAAELAALTESCRKIIQQQKHHRVLSPGSMQALFNRSPGCQASDCLSKIGNALKARWLVTGMVTEEKSGKVRLRIQKTDLETGSVETRDYFSKGNDWVGDFKNQLDQDLK